MELFPSLDPFCSLSPSVLCHQEANFATFADDIGGSERLFKTPIPLSYTRLTSRFLILFFMFLPFALWDSLNWLTIPVTIGTSAIFFCIEEVGVLIENPFPILALDVIAQSARNNVTVSLRLHICYLNHLPMILAHEQRHDTRQHGHAWISLGSPAFSNSLVSTSELDPLLLSSHSGVDLPP